MSISLTFLASLGLLNGGSASGAANEAAKKEIIAQEAELGRAMIHHDVGALQRIVGADWVCQGATGISTKASFIQDVASGKLAVTKFVLHDIHVEVFGDVAYLMGADDEESAYAGVKSDGTYNWLDVWKKRDGRWVSVATQITKAAPKA